MNNLLSQYLNFKKILSRYEKVFLDHIGITPIAGCELEFYSEESKEYITSLLNDFDVKILEEEGEKQFEIEFPHTQNLVKLSNDISAVKGKLEKIANFSAKPYKDRPPSGMHIHVNFLDKSGKNVYERENSKTPKLLAYSIGGLLEIMGESCIFFAPTEDSYQRFINHSITTPSKIAWGINNRTASIRITPIEKGTRRMECRVASACADPAKVLTAIMSGIYFGIANKITPQEPTYGVCSDDQYDLKNLPHSLEEARKMATKGHLPSILADIASD